MKLVTQHNQVSHFFCPLFTLKITSLLIKIYLILTNSSISVRILILRDSATNTQLTSDSFLFIKLLVTNHYTVTIHRHLHNIHFIDLFYFSQSFFLSHYITYHFYIHLSCISISLWVFSSISMSMIIFSNHINYVFSLSLF